MCLQPDELRALLNYLNEQLFQAGIACDHTLSRTRTWAANEGLDPERVLESLRSFGGYCDCEVAFNVRPYLFGWEEQEERSLSRLRKPVAVSAANRHSAGNPPRSIVVR